MLSVETMQWWLELLWRATWQSAVIAAIVWLIVTTCRRLITPNWRMLLWSLPIARLLMLVVPACSLSLFGLLEHGGDISFSTDPIVAYEATSSIPVTLDGPVETTPARTPVAMPSIPAKVSAGPREVSVPTPKLDWPQFAVAIVFVVWLIGAMLTLARLVLARRIIARMVALARPADADLRGRVQERVRQLGIGRAVACLVTTDLTGPAIVGLRSPKLLIPEKLCSELSPGELAAVIEHELRHIQRYDLLWLALIQVTKVVHWYHPLLYWCERRINRAMEQAVDRATIQTLGDGSSQTYGELLIKIAQRSTFQFGLLQMANRRSDLRSRIEEIATPTVATRPRTLIVGSLVAMLTVCLLSDRGATQEAPRKAGVGESEPEKQTSGKYFVTGVVTDEETRQPIADAELRFLFPSETDASKRLLTTKTDPQGRYRLAVSLGSFQLWFPAIKPGYWIVEPRQNMTTLTTSQEKPIAVHDIQVKSAPQWKIRYLGKFAPAEGYLAITEVADDELRRKMIAGEPWSSSELNCSWNSLFRSDGTGAFTQIGTSGKLLIGAVTTQAELLLDPEFDNTQVVSVDRNPDSGITTLQDSQGRVAKLVGASVQLDGQIPTIVVQGKQEKLTQIKMTGTVVNEKRAPVPGVEVRPTIKRGTGGGTWKDSSMTKTDRDGRFQLDAELVTYSDRQLNSGMMVATNLRKTGYAITDAPYVKLNGATIDLGEVVIQPGFEQRIQTVDTQGKTLAGVSLMMTTHASQHIYQARSDENGKAVVSDLPKGFVSVHATHGDRTTSTNLVVDSSEDDVVTIKLASQTKPKTAPVPEVAWFTVGKRAPELTIQAWSDGEERSLQDYRGKILVLEFWGTWCRPCLNSIPAMRKLADDFQANGIEFIGIHTPEGTIDQVNQLKRSQNWKTPTGIDQGITVEEGQTAQAFGVRGYPTIVIIDAEGIIRYRSDVQPAGRKAFMESQRKLAIANDIPWPLPEDLAPEEMAKIGNQLLYANLSHELDRVANNN